MSGPSRCQGRRKPRQQRGVATRDALLDATATLLDEVGYDGLTTKEIAVRAGTSIGAFYQFFANKDAAVQTWTNGCFCKDNDGRLYNPRDSR